MKALNITNTPPAEDKLERNAILKCACKESVLFQEGDGVILKCRVLKFIGKTAWAKCKRCGQWLIVPLNLESHMLLREFAMLMWNDALATGVKEIDKQHKELFEKINELHDACSQVKGKQKIDEVMQFLGNYVKNHFLLEESFMIRNSYPDYELHKAQHDDFIKGFIDLRNQFEEEGVGLSAQIRTNRLLGSWWTNHISKEDIALGRFLRDKK